MYNQTMDDRILDTYLLKLQTKNLKIVGVYKQGSNVLGYADKYSDIDYSIVWQNEYPKKECREKLLKELGFEINFMVDQDHKGTDKVNLNKVLYNFSHQLDINFFKIYEEINTEKVNEPKLYILGGFTRGEIIYDPENKLTLYKDSLRVTDKIRNMFLSSRSASTRNNIEALKVAADRAQTVEYIKSLNYLLITFTIQTYLQNDQFPVSPKWVENDALKFGWDSKLLDVIKTLKQGIPFKQTLDQLNDYSKEFQQ